MRKEACEEERERREAPGELSTKARAGQAEQADREGNCSLHWPFSFCGVVFILWRHLPGNLLMGGGGVVALRADAFAGRERQGLWSRCKQSYNVNTQEGFRDWLEGQ